jgi:hypothetical protein
MGQGQTKSSVAALLKKGKPIGSEQVAQLWSHYAGGQDQQLKRKDAAQFLAAMLALVDSDKHTRSALINDIIGQVYGDNDTLEFDRFKELFVVVHRETKGRFGLTSSVLTPNDNEKEKEEEKFDPLPLDELEITCYGPPPSYFENDPPKPDPVALLGPLDVSEGTSVTLEPKALEPAAVSYGPPPSVIGLDRPRKPKGPKSKPVKAEAKYGPPSAFGLGTAKVRVPLERKRKPKVKAAVDYGPRGAFDRESIKPSPKAPEREPAAVSYGPPSAFGLTDSIEVPKVREAVVDYGPPSSFGLDGAVVEYGPPSDIVDDIVVEEELVRADDKPQGMFSGLLARVTGSSAPKEPEPASEDVVDYGPCESFDEQESSEDDEEKPAANVPYSTHPMARLGKTPLLAAVSLRKEQVHLERQLAEHADDSSLMHTSRAELTAQRNYYDQQLEATGFRHAVGDKSVEELDAMTVETLISFHF